MDTATGGLNVTITSQVEVYATAKRAEKLLLFILYPYLLCGAKAGIILAVSYSYIQSQMIFRSIWRAFAPLLWFVLKYLHIYAPCHLRICTLRGRIAAGTKYVFIKSTTVYVSSSELGLPNPSPLGECAPHEGGGGHTRLRMRGWESPYSNDRHVPTWDAWKKNNYCIESWFQ